MLTQGKNGIFRGKKKGKHKQSCKEVMLVGVSRTSGKDGHKRGGKYWLVKGVKGCKTRGVRQKLGGAPGKKRTQ